MGFRGNVPRQSLVGTSSPAQADPSPRRAMTLPAADRPSYKEGLAPFARPQLSRSLLDLATSILPVVVLVVVMDRLIDVSGWLTLALAPLLAGFLLRTFIVFHDCAHGNFLPTKRANHVLGAILGVVVFQPYQHWSHDHRVHHATAGDLDRRGVGDVPTLTVAEYDAKSPGGQLFYRLFRNPLIMFTIGPLVAMVILPRLVPKGARPRAKRSVLGTDLAIAAMIVALCVVMGPWHYLLVLGPAILLAGMAGVWLFYVQHQFEDAYWESGATWDYADAALRGSSYLKLPKVLQFFSGNIGLHHVHHLSAKVPNYHLQAAHDANPIFHEVPVLTIGDGMRATRLKLWDEDRGRLVGFADRHVAAEPAGGPSPTGATLPA